MTRHKTFYKLIKECKQWNINYSDPDKKLYLSGFNDGYTGNDIRLGNNAYIQGYRYGYQQRRVHF